MLVNLRPRLDGGIDSATTVHLASKGLVCHRVIGVNGLTIGLDHLRCLVTTSSEIHITRITVIGLKGFLVNLLLTNTEAAQLAVCKDHLHHGVSVFCPLLQSNSAVACHELLKTGMIFWHQELSVVADSLCASSLIDLLLGFCDVGERQTDI